MGKNTLNEQALNRHLNQVKGDPNSERVVVVSTEMPIREIPLHEIPLHENFLKLGSVHAKGVISHASLEG